MIRGMHAMFYSSKADELRAFLRDKLGLRGTDVGEGWPSSTRPKPTWEFIRPKTSRTMAMASSRTSRSPADSRSSCTSLATRNEKRAMRVFIAAALMLAGCAPSAPGFHDAAQIDDWGMASCRWTQRFSPPIVYQESDFIRAYFEPGDLEAYRRAILPPFALPPRPLVRVSVLDFYEMVNGPIYLESEVSVLVLHEGRPGWFVLTMPVTDGDACAGGRNALGTPKVMRRITLERGAQQYVGTSYARGGHTPEFTLKLDIGEPGEAAREVLRLASVVPDFYLSHGRVLTIGGLRLPAHELESAAPGIWKVRLGEARLEFPHEPESLLHRLGVGRPLAGYWGQMRYRFSIIPR